VPDLNTAIVNTLRVGNTMTGSFDTATYQRATGCVNEFSRKAYEAHLTINWLLKSIPHPHLGTISR
jgi:hypothetical protein